jgi:hypothetical protein
MKNQELKEQIGKELYDQLTPEQRQHLREVFNSLNIRYEEPNN